MPMLRQWCNKGMLLEHGKLIAYGPLEEVMARYEGRGEAVAAAVRAPANPSA